MTTERDESQGDLYRLHPARSTELPGYSVHSVLYFVLKARPPGIKGSKDDPQPQSHPFVEFTEPRSHVETDLVPQGWSKTGQETTGVGSTSHRPVDRTLHPTCARTATEVVVSSIQALRGPGDDRHPLRLTTRSPIRSDPTLHPPPPPRDSLSQERTSRQTGSIRIVSE